jgi:hypothetical protein
MSTMDFELLALDQVAGETPSDGPDLETLRHFAGNPQSARMFHVYSGTNANGPADLPWLDVENALVIGGGADYGDDTWIALDVRLSAVTPRVVLSQFHHFGREGKRTAPSHMTWNTLSPDIESFLSILRRR